jgi:putative transcriptional regulator
MHHEIGSSGYAVIALHRKRLILDSVVDPSQGELANLSGSLLVAHPALRDPNFRRAILFLSAHGPEVGALGVIINRPTPLSLADLVATGSSEGLDRIVVYAGGPVQTEEVTLLCFRWSEDGMVVQPNLDLDEAATVVKAGTGEVRAYQGYAGWTPGQLEAELRQQAWIVLPAQRTVFRDSHDEKLWYRTVCELGPAFKLLAQAPDDPSLN